MFTPNLNLNLQVGPAVAQLAPVLRGSPFQGLAEALASEATRLAVSTDIPIPGLPRENLGPLLEIAQQIAPVIGQITDGVSEFRPTPNETRAIAAGGYYVPSTLLVRGFCELGAIVILVMAVFFQVILRVWAVRSFREYRSNLRRVCGLVVPFLSGC